MRDVNVVEFDGVGGALDEGACEGGAEVGRLRCEEGCMNMKRGTFRAD